jgi:hypothetical protein
VRTLNSLFTGGTIQLTEQGQPESVTLSAEITVRFDHSYLFTSASFGRTSLSILK